MYVGRRRRLGWIHGLFHLAGVTYAQFRVALGSCVVSSVVTGVAYRGRGE